MTLPFVRCQAAKKGKKILKIFLGGPDRSYVAHPSMHRLTLSHHADQYYHLALDDVSFGVAGKPLKNEAPSMDPYLFFEKKAKKRPSCAGVA